MRRLITLGLLGLAVIFMVAASAPWAWDVSPSHETVITWTAGDTSLGSMVIDSSSGAATTACTSMVCTEQYNADSIYVTAYSNGGDTTETPDTVWLYFEGYTKEGSVIDSSLIVVDTLNDAVGDNLFKVWNTKATAWPYMRMIKIVIEDTAGTGYQVDSTYAVFNRKGDNP